MPDRDIPSAFGRRSVPPAPPAPPLRGASDGGPLWLHIAMGALGGVVGALIVKVLAS